MSVISMGWVGGRGMGWVPDQKTAKVVSALQSMPGYGTLYGRMTGIMYAAGVQAGTQLESDLIGGGHLMVVMQAADIMKKSGAQEPKYENMTREQIDAEMRKMYASSDALIQIDAMLQKPENAAALKKMIQEEMARRGAEVNRSLTATTKYGLDIEGGGTTGDGSTAEKLADQNTNKAAVEPVQMSGIDSKTALFIAGAVVLLLMSKE